MAVKFEFSAGGVVIKREKTHTLILVAQHSHHHGWIFPKGLIGDKIKGEKKEETATREVKEETGVTAKIVKALSPVDYWYQFEGEKIHKAVYYFIMEYVSGDIKDHDFEMENVEWLDSQEVEKRLTYKSDKVAWEEAKELLQ